MEDKLFDTKAKIANGLATFANLKKYVGWKMVVDVLNANIKVLTDQIVNGVEGETVENMNRKRDKLKVYKEMANLPDVMIKNLSITEAVQDAEDPFPMVGSEGEVPEEGILDN